MHILVTHTAPSLHHHEPFLWRGYLRGMEGARAIHSFILVPPKSSGGARLWRRIPAASRFLFSFKLSISSSRSCLFPLLLVGLRGNREEETCGVGTFEGPLHARLTLETSQIGFHRSAKANRKTPLITSASFSFCPNAAFPDHGARKISHFSFFPPTFRFPALEFSQVMTWRSHPPSVGCSRSHIQGRRRWRERERETNGSAAYR